MKVKSNRKKLFMPSFLCCFMFVSVGCSTIQRGRMVYEGGDSDEEENSDQEVSGLNLIIAEEEQIQKIGQEHEDDKERRNQERLDWELLEQQQRKLTKQLKSESYDLGELVKLIDDVSMAFQLYLTKNDLLVDRVKKLSSGNRDEQGARDPIVDSLDEQGARDPIVDSLNESITEIEGPAMKIVKWFECTLTKMREMACGVRENAALAVYSSIEDVGEKNKKMINSLLQDVRGMKSVAHNSKISHASLVLDLKEKVDMAKMGEATYRADDGPPAKKLKLDDLLTDMIEILNSVSNHENELLNVQWSINSSRARVEKLPKKAGGSSSKSSETTS